MPEVYSEVGMEETPLAEDPPGPEETKVSFGLRPGGLPLPIHLHALPVVAGIAVALVGGALGHVLDIDEVAEIGLVLCFGIYWGLRKFLESRRFVPGSEIVADAQRIQIPGCLVGRAGTIVLEGDEVLGFILREQPKGLSDEGSSWTLTLETCSLGNLTFWSEAVDADLPAVARTLERLTAKPLAVEGKGHIDPGRVIAGLVGFLLAIAVVAILFMTVLSAYDRMTSTPWTPPPAPVAPDGRSD